MADTTFESLADFQNGLIRKQLKGTAFLARDHIAVPTAFTSGANAVLQQLPTGYETLGKIAADGAPTYTPDVQTAEVKSWGDLESSREDVIGRNTTITLTPHETRKSTLEAYTGADLSNVTPDATTGELWIKEPTAPATRFYRYLHLGIDGAGDDAIYIWRVAPRFQITSVGEQSAGQESAMAYPITGKAKVDEELGFAIAWVFGGPGWKPLLEKMGWDATP